jgi:hypothetical protein
MTDPQPDFDWGAVPERLRDGFEDFHRENPHVYSKLVEMVRSMHRRGRTRIGMGMLFEVLRWEYNLKADTEEPFKLNNNYRAFYTRLIEQNNPELRGVLTSRKSIADY